MQTKVSASVAALTCDPTVDDLARRVQALEARVARLAGELADLYEGHRDRLDRHGERLDVLAGRIQTLRTPGDLLMLTRDDLRALFAAAERARDVHATIPLVFDRAESMIVEHDRHREAHSDSVPWPPFRPGLERAADPDPLDNHLNDEERCALGLMPSMGRKD